MLNPLYSNSGERAQPTARITQLFIFTSIIMNTSRIIIPVAWLLSIAAAFIIGGKTTPSPEKQSASSTQKGSDHISPRRRASKESTSSRKQGSSTRSQSSRSSQGSEITAIARNDDPIARTSDLLQLISTLGVADFQGVVADFRALGITRERRAEYRMLIYAWSKVDPLGALDYAEAETGTPFARQTILASWVTDNPESAIAWANDHHEGEKANPWLVGIIQGLATTDSARATEILQGLPSSRERTTALSDIVQHIAQQGVEKGILWLESITDEKIHADATSRLADNLANTNPESTAEWVSSLSESTAKSRAAGKVADKWAQQDLQGALAWTDTLEGSSKTAAAREVIGLYAKDTPDLASTWLKTMSNDPGYERIVESYIWNTVRSNPESSLSLIPEIENVKSQYRYYERVLKSWKRSDPDATAAWMDRNEVSEELRKRVNK